MYSYFGVPGLFSHVHRHDFLIFYFNEVNLMNGQFIKKKNALVRLLIFFYVYILLETKVDIMSVLVRHTFLLKIEPFYIVTIQNKNIRYKQIGIILYSKHPSIGLEIFQIGEKLIVPFEVCMNFVMVFQ